MSKSANFGPATNVPFPLGVIVFPVIRSHTVATPPDVRTGTQRRTSAPWRYTRNSYRRCRPWYWMLFSVPPAGYTTLQTSASTFASV